MEKFTKNTNYLFIFREHQYENETLLNIVASAWEAKLNKLKSWLIKKYLKNW